MGLDMIAFQFIFVVASAILVGMPSMGMAQEDTSAADDSLALTLGDIVVVGTRVRGVAVEDLAVPVDIYDITEITATGTEDLTVALQKTAPSFNSKRNAIGDGGLFHTAVLRGMNPDHTLLLVNGKRRHSISFPRPLDQVGQGTTGADLRSIPIAAIARIEVLRDGAATQYGSDAIGGVINIVLKENSAESTASMQAGVTEEGDGQYVGAAANLGLPLGAEGVLNLTVEAYDQGRTDRAFDTSHLDVEGPHNPPIGRKVVLGAPEHDIRSLFFNVVSPLSDIGEAYAFGGWSVKNGLSSGAYRDTSWDAKRLVEPIHPDGFLPFEESRAEDQSVSVGIRSSLGSWGADTSFNYGANTFDFGAIDSINASWAAAWLDRELDSEHPPTISPAAVQENAGPTSGDSGGTKLETWSLDVDLSGSIGTNTEAALGAEFRRESFRIRAGDFASWGCGDRPERDPQDAEAFPVVTLESDGTVGQHTTLFASCGHQGYPGYSPSNARFGARDRDSYAAWADLRHDVTADLNVEVAARFENYDGAGDSLTGMIGSRYHIGHAVTVRGTASTGFRAPSLPQLGYNTVSFIGGGEGKLSVTANLDDGTARRVFGVGPSTLQHETSRNISAGFTWSVSPELSFSADAYRIQLDDRITNVGASVEDTNCFPRHMNEVCENFANERRLPPISNISYFDNAVDTKTEGFDFVVSYDTAMLNGDLSLIGSLHFNRTKITSGSSRISGHVRSYIEEGNPREKYRLAAFWTDGDAFDLSLTLNYFGKAAPHWFNISEGCPGEISPAWIADVSAGWKVSGVQITVGVDNLLDRYPNRIGDASCLNLLNGVLGWGILYNPDSSYGLSGRTWYTRIGTTF